MPSPHALRNDIVQHIKQHMKEEEEDPPIPRKYDDIPVSYDAITKEWLNAVLAGDSGAVVRSFKLGPEDNGSANRRGIQIEWEQSDAAKGLPTSVFCKAAHSLQNRIVLAAGGTISETLFYNHIRTKLDIEAPQAHYARYDPDSWAAMIMLHDMEGRATFCNHKTILTKTQFIEQFQVLAKLHGTFYNSKDPGLENILIYKNRIANLTKVGLESACKNGFRAAKSVIPPRLFAKESEIWPCTLKSVERNASLPPTVVHGDVHLGNWYITPEGHMGLTDWQAMARGHWSRDVAYVLGTGVSTENRRLWEKEAVQTYLSQFKAHGGPDITEEEAWLEIRRQTLGALAYWTLTLTPSTAMPDMQSEETTLIAIGRITALMDDHQILDAFDF